MPHTVAALTDSRGFDTYYTNSNYSTRYGYNRTFPHLWRKLALGDPQSGYDVVHIPDHFRGGTIQNNIVRLALTDPDIVVILDGIWETLLNKGHFLDYLKRNPDSGENEDEYSHRRIADLFIANRLSVSPKQYALQQAKLVSYFRRRRRQIIWMTLPVLPKDYIGSTYHAGDYVPIATWDECLDAINVAMKPVVQRYGGALLDLTEMMYDAGGPEVAFIDQWHFSEPFHHRISRTLDKMCCQLLEDAPDASHISRAFMLGADNTEIPGDDVVIYEGDPADEASVLESLGPRQILIYPSEIGEIDNPRGNDRAEFEKMAVR